MPEHVPGRGAGPEPDEQRPPGGSGPTALTEEPIDALRARAARLESENRQLLREYADRLQAENEQIRRSMGADPPRPAVSRAGVVAPAELAQDPAPHTAARLARDLVAVEGHLADVERFAALGEDREAARAQVAAVTRACSALEHVCADADFRQLLMDARDHVQAHPELTGQDPRTLHLGDDRSFREVEVALLHLSGLSRALADAHVDAALAAFTEGPGRALQRVQDPTAFLGDLRALRDATCQSADVLAMGVRRAASRARWRKVLTYGLGGTAILTANGLGVALLGPLGVAASQAIASAAIGVGVAATE